MSRVDVIEFKCDVCGKVHRKEYDPVRPQISPLKTVNIPAKRYDCEGKNFNKGTSNVDMCEKCFVEYWEYMQSRYEVTDFNESKVVVKVK